MAGERYSPKNPFANIHGMVSSKGMTTCVTREEKTCTGCCTALLIVDQFNNNKTLKVEATNCPAQISSIGCKHIINGKPQDRFWVCMPYHCSGDRRKIIVNNPKEIKIAAAQRLTLENTACLYNGEINKITYRENLERIPFRG